jgi:uncharacterized protein (DUF433 family)
MASTVTEYIEFRQTRGAGKVPFISGTRVRVADVYVYHELQGLSPDRIVASHPHLTLAQVHAALAYFFDHTDEIRGQLREEADLIQSLKSQIGPGPLSSKLNMNDPDADQVSS